MRLKRRMMYEDKLYERKIEKRKEATKEFFHTIIISGGITRNL